jgi:hypothetical protein
MPEIIRRTVSRFIGEPSLEELLGQILGAQPEGDRRGQHHTAQRDPACGHGVELHQDLD